MTVTRRVALLHGAALGAALVVPYAGGAGWTAAATGAGGEGSGRTDAYSHAAWKARVGSTVRVAGRPGSALRVVAVQDGAHVTRSNDKPGRGDVFTIRFAGHSGPALDEGIHILDDSALGSPSLFLIPAGPGSAYQAVVNTWLPESGSGKAVNGVGTVSR
ncbi:DUF6916 family protein [Streptomyces sp. NPDC005262]|uniref:DUF6916 family protein n=1 Tax=Streptomyces sp. NPDC005262 TaxID=3364710 RepID=UPI00368ACF6E